MYKTVLICDIKVQFSRDLNALNMLLERLNYSDVDLRLTCVDVR